MGRRKGEITRAQINRDWPHQVALREDAMRARFDQVMRTAKLLECAPRNHSVVHQGDGYWYSVYCFASEEAASEFRKLFGGMDFDPRDMGSGAKWHQWNPSNSRRSHS